MFFKLKNLYITDFFMIIYKTSKPAQIYESVSFTVTHNQGPPSSVVFVTHYKKGKFSFMLYFMEII